MSEPSGTAREAAERAAQAVVANDLATLLASLTPDAMAQLTQLAAAAGPGVTPGTGGPVSSYELIEVDKGQDCFRVRFTSAAGSATFETAWGLVAGEWKITSLARVPEATVERP